MQGCKQLLGFSNRNGIHCLLGTPQAGAWVEMKRVHRVFVSSMMAAVFEQLSFSVALLR